MRLAEEDVKVLYKIVENTTIDELLEEANNQAGHIARILSSRNRQYGISRGSLRIAGDIAVNLGIIYILVGAAAKDMKTEDIVIILQMILLRAQIPAMYMILMICCIT